MHNKCVNGSPFFRAILSPLEAPTYKLPKYLEPILEPLTNNKYIDKDSFNFATEIFEQDSSSFIGNLDIDSLFTNILTEETIKVYTNNLFNNSDIVHGLKKTEFKDLLL